MYEHLETVTRHTITLVLLLFNTLTETTDLCRCCSRKARVSLLAVGRLLMASHSMSLLIWPLSCSVHRHTMVMVESNNITQITAGFLLGKLDFW